MRTLVVGDLHGCREELEELLEVAGFTTGDRLVLAGDLVAKGPDSQGVVQLAREKKALAVLGNHDAHLLGTRAGHPAKKSQLALADSMTSADWDYLEALPLWLELPEHHALVVHAGLVPGVPLPKQDKQVLLNVRSLDQKGHPSARIELEGGVPWASRWPGPELVIFGHDAVRGLQRHPHAWGLDSGCVYGKVLSALWLPDLRLVQVKAHRVWKKPD